MYKHCIIKMTSYNHMANNYIECFQFSFVYHFQLFIPAVHLFLLSVIFWAEMLSIFSSNTFNRFSLDYYAAKRIVGFKKKELAKKPRITDDMIQKMEEQRKWKHQGRKVGKCDPRNEKT